MLRLVSSKGWRGPSMLATSVERAANLTVTRDMTSRERPASITRFDWCVGCWRLDRLGAFIVSQPRQQRTLAQRRKGSSALNRLVRHPRWRLPRTLPDAVQNCGDRFNDRLLVRSTVEQ